MISVLIPVYNTQVTDLIAALENQLSASGVPFEIIVMDDGSVESYKKQNRAIQENKQVLYTELPYNIGRIAIRNALSQKAAFNWLLFLDADSAMVNNRFIDTYLGVLDSKADVVVGGRIYSTEKPAECRFRLHWTYGSQREQQLPETRRKRPHAGFMSNNFFIRKDVFLQLKITEELSGYGHEDTWMGIQLQQLGAKVVHIANPVLHNGLEESQVFFEKSLNSLHNLEKLQTIVGKNALSDHVKLFAAYCRYKKLGLFPFLNTAISIAKPLIIKRLYSCKPSLFLFDLYRLNYFARLNRSSD